MRPAPIARIQVSLGIIEQRATPSQREYVEGLHEEVEHMSGLVNELLSFSRAQVSAAKTVLTEVNVADTVARVLQREASQSANVENHVDAGVDVVAQPDSCFSRCPIWCAMRCAMPAMPAR